MGSGVIQNQHLCSSVSPKCWGGSLECWAATKHRVPQAPWADSAQLLKSPVDGSPLLIFWCGWPSPTSLAGAPCQESWRPRHHFPLEGSRRQLGGLSRASLILRWPVLPMGGMLCFSKWKLLCASVLGKFRWSFWPLRNVDFSKCKTITQRTLRMQMPRSTVFLPHKRTHARTQAHVHTCTQTHIESEVLVKDEEY